MTDINFDIYEQSLDFYFQESETVQFDIGEDSPVNFNFTEEVVDFSILYQDLYFSVVEEEIIFNIESLSTGGGSVGGGYNFLDITSPADGVDVGQDTTVTISGTTMRNSGSTDNVPSVTVEGQPVDSIYQTEDRNVFEFTHEASLEGGENLLNIISDNNSLSVTKNITVYRDNTIDNTPPDSTHTITGTQDSGYYTETPQIELSATDDQTGVDNIYYRINGGSWQTYSGIFNVSNEGSVTLEYYAVDNNGNEEVINSTSWQADLSPPVTNIDITGTHYQGDWYRSDVSVSLSSYDAGSSVVSTYMAVDGGSFIEGKTTHTFTADGQHTVEYYSVDEVGNTESVNTDNINIDTQPISISGITSNMSEWYYGDGQVTYTVEMGEDTTGFTGEIDLSAFGGSSNASLNPYSTQMIISFTPAKQNATASPSVQIWDQAGNTATGTAPQLITHEYRIAPEDMYFPAFSYVSEPLDNSKIFTDDSSVEAEWGADYSRSGILVYGDDFYVVDSNKIELTSKWQDDVESNSLGNMYVTAWED